MKESFPLPTSNLSNGEFDPAPQTQDQRRVEKITLTLADRIGRKLGLGRRVFLKSLCGMAAAFLAMNEVYGPVFEVSEAEAADPLQARERAHALSGQFIFDDQVHFVHDQFQFQGLLDLRSYAAEHWNPALKGKQSIEKIRFRNFLREVFLESDTKIALLSGAPAENRMDWFLSNDELADARALVNSIAGSRRMLCHAVITPGQKGWIEEMDRVIEVLKPDSWKGYTVGDPLSNSRFPFRLDDESLMYPAYEKMQKAGIKNVCIHKGLVPNDYLISFENWKYAKVDDLGKAARDWPGLNFVIYHAALKPLNEYPESHLELFQRTGRIDWVTDLAGIPSKFGVTNVYADLGTCFASCAVTHPRHAAALVGILVKGLGSDHVVWGTDSVWYGSPQWQIEAFRRLEIPQDMQHRFGFTPLGGPDSPVKRAILGTNSARLYGLEEKSSAEAFKNDRFALIKERDPRWSRFCKTVG